MFSGGELFEVFRANAAGAEQGAVTYVLPHKLPAREPGEAERVHDHFAFAEVPH